MPKIDSRILKRTFTTTPKRISQDILSFCREISPKHEPCWVDAVPDASAVVGECFENVSVKVANYGGETVFGWNIWEWDRVFIEAEHHAVWQKEGRLIDITPHTNAEQKILFLPDPNRKFDFEHNKRLMNFKKNLGQTKGVDQWIEASDQLQKFLEDHSTGREFDFDSREFGPYAVNLRNAQLALLVELARRRKVNDRCICISGKKFKRCCMPLFDFPDGY